MAFLTGQRQFNRTLAQIWGGRDSVKFKVDDDKSYNARWAETRQPVQPYEWASSLALETGQAVLDQLLKIERLDGDQAFVLNSAAPIFNEQHQIVECVAVLTDITERRRAEEALRKSERKNQAILNAIPDLMFRLNRTGDYLDYWAKKEGELYIPPELISGHNLQEHMPPDFTNQALGKIQAALDTGAVQTFEYAWPMPPGPRHYEARLAVSGPDEIVALVRDITERKEAELQNARLLAQVQAGQKRLRQLTDELVTAQEAERQRIARELHDEAGQALTALRLQLHSAQTALPPTLKVVREQLVEASALVSLTHERLHWLAQDLHPPALEAIPLHQTLAAYCHSFARYTHLAVGFQGQPVPTLPGHIAICFYRFLQEALTNVVKHAQARRVWVILGRHAATIRLTVVDDGLGFNPAVIPPPTSGLGLRVMRDRFETFSGDLEIDSQPPSGTRLTVWLPWEAQP